LYNGQKFRLRVIQRHLARISLKLFAFSGLLICTLNTALGAPKKLLLQTQIGVTQAEYAEPALGASSEQIGLHIKQGFTYRLVQNRIDLYLGAYINGLGNWISAKEVLTTGASETPGGPTYWGISFRAPISLSPKASRWDFRISPGYSTWGMLVKDNQYGLQLLAAPTLSFSLRNRKSGTRSWGIGLKFSPLEATLAAFSSNRELAIGFDFQLNSARAKRPLSLNIDYSSTLFNLPTDNNGQLRDGDFSSLSAGLALQW